MNYRNGHCLQAEQPEEFSIVAEDEPEVIEVPKEIIITKDGMELTPVLNKLTLDFNKMHPVTIKEEEISETTKDIKTHFGIDIGSEFFDFGGLKRKISIVPGFADDYNGTDDEKKKYDDYIEFRATIGRIQMFEEYLKTFDGLLLLPLAAQNASSVSDTDIHVSIQIDDSTAEVVYPTAELICDELRGIEGYVYENGLIEMTLSLNDTVDIKSSVDDRFWSIEDQRSDMNAMLRGGINGQPRYSAEDYVHELSRYIATPEDGNPTVFSFCISSLHAKEAKWLPRTIVLKPKNETIRMKYFVKSSSSDGNLEGTLELKI